MKAQKHMIGNEPLVSGLIETKLTTSQILNILGSGGKVRHRKLGYLVWLSGSKLDSDGFKWVGSLPQFIFNADIAWIPE